MEPVKGGTKIPRPAIMGARGLAPGFLLVFKPRSHDLYSQQILCELVPAVCVFFSFPLLHVLVAVVLRPIGNSPPTEQHPINKLYTQRNIIHLH